MKNLVCEVCGGTIIPTPENPDIGVCDSCEAVWSIPKNLEEKANLYNRAIFERDNANFDKAESTYERILQLDPNDTEALWGLTLSKYGVEFVLDPRTFKYIPTLHRMSPVPIISDPDYLKALELADPYTRGLYQQRAEEIAEVQRGISEIAAKEEPYDIFISYKESDNLGNRTEDSIIAQNLYDELTKKGYRVFFSRKSLDSRTGEAYEPIIYSALMSAPLMMIVGTKLDYIEAPWVKNEWNRFLKMDDKTVFVAYKDLNPYDLPPEMSLLQSMDMNKLGFIQELTDGAERVLGKKNENSNFSQQQSIVHDSLNRLIENAETYTRIGNKTEAENTLVEITQKYPESLYGWLGLLKLKTNNFTDLSMSTLYANKNEINYILKLTETVPNNSERIEVLDYCRSIYNESINDAKEKAEKLAHNQQVGDKNNLRINQSALRNEEKTYQKATEQKHQLQEQVDFLESRIGKKDRESKRIWLLSFLIPTFSIFIIVGIADPFTLISPGAMLYSLFCSALSAIIVAIPLGLIWNGIHNKKLKTEYSAHKVEVDSSLKVNIDKYKRDLQKAQNEEKRALEEINETKSKISELQQQSSESIDDIYKERLTNIMKDQNLPNSFDEFLKNNIQN